MVAEAIGEDVGGSVLEADVGAVGFGLGPAVVEERREGRIGDAMGVLVVLLIGNSAMPLALSSGGVVWSDDLLILGLQKLNHLPVEILDLVVTGKYRSLWCLKVGGLWQWELVS